MNVLLLIDVSRDSLPNEMSLLPVMLLLGAVLVLSITFLAALVFFLIRYKRRKLDSCKKSEPSPGIEQLTQPE
jgi:hypothetical protein